MLGLLILCLSSVWAARLEELDPGQSFELETVEIEGNQSIAEGALLDAMISRARPFYAFWSPRARFDPVVFEADLERLKRLYEAQGYYDAEVDYDLGIAEGRRVTVRIAVKEGRAMVVDRVRVASPEPAPPVALPLERGAVFTEAAYQEGERRLREYYLERGHAHVQTARKAEVDLKRHRARVEYRVRPGAQAVFGETRVEGLEKVDPSLVLRELAYASGEQYSLDAIQRSREDLLALDLFRSVQLRPDATAADSARIPMHVRVEEQAPRNIVLGVGYGTEDGVRGRVAWSHRNWLGGGRQLSVDLKASFINRTLAASLVQPHFLSRHTRAALGLSQTQEDEETYLLNLSRFDARLDHRFTHTLSGYFGYRFGFAALSNVDRATSDALGGIREDGLIAGPSLGLTWNTAGDLFDPGEGNVLSLSADHGGPVWGGEYSFVKLTAEARRYQPIGWKTVLAARLEVGVADALGAEEDFPLFERYFAGGERSVRGYGRRRLGPLGATGDPLGGLSLVEGSVELRRPLWREWSGALFVDFGQVSLSAFDPPFDELDLAIGAGVAYRSPVGPLRLDIGVPLDPPRGDSAFAVHFSIGQFF